MANSKEVLTQFRTLLEIEIKDTFLWAIGQSALTEMTKTVREREPRALLLNKLYISFHLHFTPEKKYNTAGPHFPT